MIAFLLVLPTLVTGRIYIDIVPATDSKNASVLYSGSQTWPITATDQEAFYITDFGILYNLPRMGYKAPTYVYVGGASRFGYRDLKITLRPIGAKIVGHKKRSVIVTVKEFRNNMTVPAVFKGGVKEDVVETLGTRWTHHEELSVGRSIVLKFQSGSISHTSSWGEEVHETKTRSLSTSSDVEVTLQPDQTATAVLKATRALLEVEVDYEATIEGDIYCRYAFFWIPYQDVAFDVHKFFDLMKLPHEVRSSEIVSVDYYYGAEIDVLNGEHKVPFVF